MLFNLLRVKIFAIGFISSYAYIVCCILFSINYALHNLKHNLFMSKITKDRIEYFLIGTHTSYILYKYS